MADFNKIYITLRNEVVNDFDTKYMSSSKAVQLIAVLKFNARMDWTEFTSVAILCRLMKLTEDTANYKTITNALELLRANKIIGYSKIGHPKDLLLITLDETFFNPKSDFTIITEKELYSILLTEITKGNRYKDQLFMTFLYIKKHINTASDSPMSGLAFPSIKRISDNTGMAKATVEKNIQILQNLQLLVVKHYNVVYKEEKQTKLQEYNFYLMSDSDDKKVQIINIISSRHKDILKIISADSVEVKTKISEQEDAPVITKGSTKEIEQDEIKQDTEKDFTKYNLLYERFFQKIITDKNISEFEKAIKQKFFTVDQKEYLEKLFEQEALAKIA